MSLNARKYSSEQHKCKSIEDKSEKHVEREIEIQYSIDGIFVLYLLLYFPFICLLIRISCTQKSVEEECQE